MIVFKKSLHFFKINQKVFMFSDEFS